MKQTELSLVVDEVDRANLFPWQFSCNPHSYFSPSFPPFSSYPLFPTLTPTPLPSLLPLSGMESPPSRKYLPVYLEFIQHHLLLGVTHMFLSSPFAWGGNMMTSLLRYNNTTTPQQHLNNIYRIIQHVFISYAICDNI